MTAFPSRITRDAFTWRSKRSGTSPSSSHVPSKLNVSSRAALSPCPGAKPPIASRRESRSPAIGDVPLRQPKIAAEAPQLRKPHRMPPVSQASEIVLHEPARLEVAQSLPVLVPRHLLVPGNHCLDEVGIPVGQALARVDRAKKGHHRGIGKVRRPRPIGTVRLHTRHQGATDCGRRGQVLRLEKRLLEVSDRAGLFRHLAAWNHPERAMLWVGYDRLRQPAD